MNTRFLVFLCVLCASAVNAFAMPLTSLTTTQLTISGPATEEGSGGSWDAASLAAAATRLPSGGFGSVEYSDPVGQASKLLVVGFADPGLDPSHTIRGITVEATSNASTPDPRPIDSTVQLRFGAAGGATSANLALGTSWPASTLRSYGGASHVWGSGATGDWLRALKPGNLGNLKFTLKMTSSQPSLWLLDTLAVSVVSGRAAQVDLGLVERLIVTRLESVLSDADVLKRYAGEEQPEQTSGGEKPWLELVALDPEFEAGGRGGDVPGGADSPDRCGLVLSLTLGVPDVLTRARTAALSTLISRVRQALMDVTLSDSGGEHRVDLNDFRATVDRDSDPSRRARTAGVIIRGEVWRTSGGLLET